MAQRLVERFRVGAEVEVLLRTRSGEAWAPARVVAHAHPGVWVEAAGGARWFVTNGTRIRERGRWARGAATGETPSPASRDAPPTR